MPDLTGMTFFQATSSSRRSGLKTSLRHQHPARTRSCRQPARRFCTVPTRHTRAQQFPRAPRELTASPAISTSAPTRGRHRSRPNPGRR